MASPAKRVLIYGGKGALGSVCVSYFKSKSWWVGSIDMKPNEEANANALVSTSVASWTEQETEVLNEVGNILQGEKIDALICVAGGWAGGNGASDDFIKNADLMWKQSVWTSTIAVRLASKYLKEGGLLSLTGAKAALEGTPGMIGYGMAKAAVHQLVKSAAQPKSGIPKDALTVAILPVTLDTPMNRKFMPKADFGSWTPLPFVAELFYKWSTSVERPANGSLVQLITQNGETRLEIA